MKLELNNMLEVANLIDSLEARLKFEKEVTENEASFNATNNIYKQVQLYYPNLTSDINFN